MLTRLPHDSFGRRPADLSGAGVPCLADVTLAPHGAGHPGAAEALLLLPDHAARPETLGGPLLQPAAAAGGQRTAEWCPVYAYTLGEAVWWIFVLTPAVGQGVLWCGKQTAFSTQKYRLEFLVRIVRFNDIRYRYRYRGLQLLWYLLRSGLFYPLAHVLWRIEK